MKYRIITMADDGVWGYFLPAYGTMEVMQSLCDAYQRMYPGRQFRVTI